MNGVTRSIAFRKDGSHPASTSTETCGFLPMEGIGGQSETVFQVPARGGGHITLRYEDDAPTEPPLPDDILASAPDRTKPLFPDRLLSVFPKRYGTATINWPPKRVPGRAAANRVLPTR
jgi:hypothetical protein